MQILKPSNNSRTLAISGLTFWKVKPYIKLFRLGRSLLRFRNKALSLFAAGLYFCLGGHVITAPKRRWIFSRDL
jgi:hypothetical protein